MKTTTVCLFAFFILFTAFQVLAEEDFYYGRKLITLTDADFEALEPNTEHPLPGTKPDEEWEQYNALLASRSPSKPVWSPDGSLIVYIGSYTNIYIVPAEGGVPTKIWDGNSFFEYEGEQYYMHTGGMISSLCFSPDGTEVLFDGSIIDEERGTVVTLHFNEDGGFSGAGINSAISVIRAVNITTGDTRIVVDSARKPQISRNGKYLSFRDSKTAILTVRDVSTGAEWMLEGVSILNRCFSGDGNYIQYDKTVQFFRIPVTGGDSEKMFSEKHSTLFTSRLYPDTSPGDDFILFDGDVGGRSKTFYDEDGNEIGHYSTTSMSKIFVYSVETGLSLPLVPIEGGAESTSAKFSPDGTKICYTMRDRDTRGSRQEIYIKEFDGVSFMKQTQVGEEKLASFAITGNYPNPFNPSTTIEFSLPEAGFAELVIYNVTGQKIRTLVTETMTPGVHSIVWDGHDDNGLPVSAGLYVTRLQMNDAVTSDQMMLVK